MIIHISGLFSLILFATVFFDGIIILLLQKKFHVTLLNVYNWIVSNVKSLHLTHKDNLCRNTIKAAARDLKIQTYKEFHFSAIRAC